MSRVLTWLETDVPPWVEPPRYKPGSNSDRLALIAFAITAPLAEVVVVCALSLVVTLVEVAVPSKTIAEAAARRAASRSTKSPRSTVR